MMDVKQEVKKEVKRGDLFWCNLDGMGSEQKGVKVVAVIQNNTGNRFSPTVIVAVLTRAGKKKPHLPTHYFIEKGSAPDDSVMMLEQIRTVDKIRLGEQIGHLSEEEIEGIDKYIKVSLGMK